MTSTRLASSGFSEGFGQGAQSRGLIKPSLGHCYLTIFLFGTVLVPNRKVTPNQKFEPSKGGVCGVPQRHNQERDKGQNFNICVGQNRLNCFCFFFFSLFPAHFLAVTVKGAFQRFYTVPPAISTKCRPICQKSYRRTLFWAGNCMISYMFEKLN